MKMSFARSSLVQFHGCLNIRFTPLASNLAALISDYDVDEDIDWWWWWWYDDDSRVVSHNLCSIISHLKPTTFIKLPFDSQLNFSFNYDDDEHNAEAGSHCKIGCN